ncbi:MAG: transporter substrate-binding domain-containing protein, partial [Terrimicrobiaceae bacterium]
LRSFMKPLQIEEWAVAVRKDDTEMTQAVNEFLKAFRATGGFERLSETYLSKQKQAFDNQGIPFIF